MATTLGQVLFNDALPPELRSDDEVTKKKLEKILFNAARLDPDQYARVVQDVKRVGDHVATYEGLSVGLADIQPEYAKRNPIMKKALADMRAAKTDAEKTKILLRTQDDLQGIAAGHPSDLATMARSGGRGSMAQFMKIVGSPVVAQRSDGSVAPYLITHSYSEGLDPDEFWLAAGEARINAVATKNSVADPGAYGKVLVANMQREVVTSPDCGTKNGIMMAVNDPQILDRALAMDVGSYKRNQIMDPQMASQMTSDKLLRVKVRSSITCELSEGVCQMCYGKDERGYLPRIGTNVGVRSAQALSEPLTQFALNAKHGVRMASDEDKTFIGLKGVQNFLEFPQSFNRKAVVSSSAGTVADVRAAPQGGWYIRVDKKTHYAPPGIDPLVKKGDYVRAGDVLTKGISLPDDVVKYKDIGGARKHVADTTHTIYANSGRTLDKRHTELLAKSFMAYTRVVRDPSGEFVSGEVVPYGAVQARYRTDTKTTPLDEAQPGQRLGKAANEYLEGTKLTPAILFDLKRDGITELEIYTGTLDTRPIAKPLTRNPLLDPDWMARMGHRYLRSSMLEGAAEGQVSDIHSVSPTAAYAYGVEFGQGRDGRY